MSDRRLVLYGMIAAFVVACLIVIGAYADSGIPEGVQAYQYGGKYCIRDVELGKHFCWCEDECGGEYECPTPVPTNTREPDPTKTPKKATPTHTPVLPTVTPEPTEKAKANCGLGNKEEGADPNENACGDKTGEENEPSGPPGKD